MLYRVVLIFPDTTMMARFITYAEVGGEAKSNEYTFAGELTEEQISIARLNFGAYVRVVREIL